MCTLCVSVPIAAQPKGGHRTLTAAPCLVSMATSPALFLKLFPRVKKKNPAQGSWMLSPCVLLTCLISVAPLSPAEWELLAALRSLSCHGGGYFCGKEVMPTS